MTGTINAIGGTAPHGLHGALLVGKGFASDVYAWGQGRVVKLYHCGVSVELIEREFLVTRTVHATGLPVPAAYELVEIDGRRGIVLERIEGVSLFRQVQAKPWKLFAAVKRLAELHVQINSCIAPAELPSQREWIAGRIAATDDLTEDDKQRARQALDKLPDGNALCHADFHPENIIDTAHGPVIIDWGSATRGHPAGDAACTSLLIQKANLPDWAPRYTHLLLAATRLLVHRCYLSHYTRSGLATREQIAAWEVPLAAAARGLRYWRRQNVA